MTPLDWHPIGSAPKDGHLVDLYVQTPTGKGRWCNVYWDELGQQWVRAEQDIFELFPVPEGATHWMRVPPPPLGDHR